MLNNPAALRDPPVAVRANARNEAMTSQMANLGATDDRCSFELRRECNAKGNARPRLQFSAVAA
jgi:hypothetical protein